MFQTKNTDMYKQRLLLLISDSSDKKTFNSATFSASADSTGSILYKTSIT